MSNQRPPAIRIGVLGGTFDPPHNGHLAIARAALDNLELRQVLFAPSRQPPHKPNQPITSVQERLDMVRLAIAPYPFFEISHVDIDREGPTYTVDTLQLLHRQWGAQADLVFIMGMDSLATLLNWYKPEELIQLARLAVFERPGFHADLNVLAERLPGIRERVVFIPAPPLDIAASDIQRRVRAGEPITGLVPEVIAAYINTHHLYRNKA